MERRMTRKWRGIYWPGKYDGFPPPFEETEEAAAFALQLHEVPSVFRTPSEAAWFAEWRKHRK